MKGKKARCEQYVMNGHKKKIRSDIVIDVKYLKGKREKGAWKPWFCGFWCQMVSKKGQYCLSKKIRYRIVIQNEKYC